MLSLPVELQTKPRHSPLSYINYAIVAAFIVILISQFAETFKGHGGFSRPERKSVLARCENINVIPGTFQMRSESDRFVPETKATLLRNGKVSIPCSASGCIIISKIL
jgi:hypothetical protein